MSTAPVRDPAVRGPMPAAADPLAVFANPGGRPLPAAQAANLGRAVDALLASGRDTATGLAQLLQNMPAGQRAAALAYLSTNHLQRLGGDPAQAAQAEKLRGALTSLAQSSDPRRAQPQRPQDGQAQAPGQGSDFFKIPIIGWIGAVFAAFFGQGPLAQQRGAQSPPGDTGPREPQAPTRAAPVATPPRREPAPSPAPVPYVEPPFGPR